MENELLQWIHPHCYGTATESLSKISRGTKYHRVFALGVGGTGEQPQDIYLFPLNKIKYPILREDYIAKYLKKEEIFISM